MKLHHKSLIIKEKYLVRLLVWILAFMFPVVFLGVEGVHGAETSAVQEHKENNTSFNPGDMILHHIKDDYSWHLATIGNTHVSIPLPLILYSQQGLDVFLSSKFHHGHEAYKGYQLEHGHLVRSDGKKFHDFSITKNVTALFINAILMLVVFITIARRYKTGKNSAPKGIQSVFEPIIVFVKDEIAKPNIGEKHEKYLPYLLTLFFFIWFGNLMGLTPGAANLTGNIAITSVLALCTLGFTLFSAGKAYWMHIINPPGVPFLLKPIIIPVEVIGIFTKPFSLLIRLFVAITAGHIVMLSLLSLAFIFHSYMVGIAGGLIVLFITFIELLVATIQAYVFTLFSSLYIGMAVEEGHH